MLVYSAWIGAGIRKIVCSGAGQLPRPLRNCLELTSSDDITPENFFANAGTQDTPAWNHRIFR